MIERPICPLDMENGATYRDGATDETFTVADTTVLGASIQVTTTAGETFTYGGLYGRIYRAEVAEVEVEVEVADESSQFMNNAAEVTAWLNERTAYYLSSEAECSSPDSNASAGSSFLRQVRNEVVEFLDELTDAEVHEWCDEAYALDWCDLRDNIHERVDALVPVYTHDLWATFVDLGAYAEDVSEYVDPDDLEKCAAVAVHLIGERLMSVLVESAHESLWSLDMVEARREVVEHATDYAQGVASWVEVTNTDWARSFVEDIDPQTQDSLRFPNLSGEFADDPTPSTIAEVVSIDEAQTEDSDLWSSTLSELCDLWVEVAERVFGDEVERKCLALIAEVRSNEVG